VLSKRLISVPPEQSLPEKFIGKRLQKNSSDSFQIVRCRLHIGFVTNAHANTVLPNLTGKNIMEIYRLYDSSLIALMALRSRALTVAWHEVQNFRFYSWERRQNSTFIQSNGLPLTDLSEGLGGHIVHLPDPPDTLNDGRKTENFQMR
jgi:hypothetical protein